MILLLDEILKDSFGNSLKRQEKMRKIYDERLTASFTIDEVEKAINNWPHIKRLDHVLCAEIHEAYQEWDELSADEYPQGIILRLTRKKVY